MRWIRFLGLVLSAWIITTLGAAACTASMPAQAERSLVPARAIDQGLLDAAFRAEVNRHRCARGLRALEAARPMVSQASGHAGWMAQASKLSHVSSVRGRSRLMDRLKASGLRFQTASENIGMVPRFQIDGGRFQIEDAGACRFSRNGQALGAHSYASLARHAVQLWMDSPGHRRNILHPGVHRVATAGAFQPDGYCGRVWLAQNFVG